MPHAAQWIQRHRLALGLEWEAQRRRSARQWSPAMSRPPFPGYRSLWLNSALAKATAFESRVASPADATESRQGSLERSPAVPARFASPRRDDTRMQPGGTDRRVMRRRRIRRQGRLLGAPRILRLAGGGPDASRAQSRMSGSRVRHSRFAPESGGFLHAHRLPKAFMDGTLARRRGARRWASDHERRGLADHPPRMSGLARRRSAIGDRAEQRPSTATLRRRASWGAACCATGSSTPPVPPWRPVARRTGRLLRAVQSCPLTATSPTASGRTGRRGYAFRSLWDSGAVVANGSDAPVEELDPLAGIRAGVLRTIDERPAWHPDQCLTVEEALVASTVNPAWLSGDERRRGKLLPGYLADLVVLSRDRRVPARRAETVEVVGTMVGVAGHNRPRASRLNRGLLRAVQSSLTPMAQVRP